ncbi:MAG TPA: hypothetical protein VJI96_02300 [Candidatus Andersenbacteria bacterium]|nr:hypothetical protein [Candidatus Andersenbacteria bacterium]
MKNKIPYVFFGVGAVLLIGVGLLVDRVGDIDTRSDGVSPALSLSFSNPVMRGVPVTVRWTGQRSGNVGVTMHFVSVAGQSVIGSGKLSTAFMRVTIPCTVSGGLARLELRDAITKATLASRPVTSLPPGPDCVR